MVKLKLVRAGTAPLASATRPRDEPRSGDIERVASADTSAVAALLASFPRLAPMLGAPATLNGKVRATGDRAHGTSASH